MWPAASPPTHAHHGRHSGRKTRLDAGSQHEASRHPTDETGRLVIPRARRNRSFASAWASLLLRMRNPATANGTRFDHLPVIAGHSRKMRRLAERSVDSFVLCVYRREMRA